MQYQVKEISQQKETEGVFSCKEFLNFILSPFFYNELEKKLNDYRSCSDEELKYPKYEHKNDLNNYHYSKRSKVKTIKPHKFTLKSESSYCFPNNKYVCHKFSYDPKLAAIYAERE